MKKILFGILMLAGVSLSAVSTFSATTTVGTGTMATGTNNLMEITNLQSELNRMKSENTTLESENKKLEAEVKKLKKHKGILLGTTVLGAVGTGVGTAFWLKNRGDKKDSEYVLAQVKDVKKCMTDSPDTFTTGHADEVSECSSLTTDSEIADVLKCHDKLPTACTKTAK
ncbi:MAG: FtsB family cell division protein [Alphaproteobacteria bacterium]